MRRSSDHHASFPPPPPRRHPRGQQQLPRPSSIRRYRQLFIPPLPSPSPSRHTSGPPVVHRPCKSVVSSSRLLRKGRRNQLEIRGRQTPPLLRITSRVVPRLPACPLPPGGGDHHGLPTKDALLLRIPDGIVTAAVCDQTEVPADIHSENSPSPSLGTIRIDHGSQGAIPPQDPFVVPESQLTGDAAQRSLPLQKGCLLCQWRMGNGQVGQDL